MIVILSLKVYFNFGVLGVQDLKCLLLNFFQNSKFLKMFICFKHASSLSKIEKRM